MEVCDKILCKFIDESDRILRDGGYEHLVFENGQGLLLSEDASNVHTTPSNTGCSYSIEMLKNVAGLSEVDVNAIYVSRPYVTRHGAGELPHENPYLATSSSIELDTTNVFNKWQGKLRYADLNMDSLLDRCTKDFQICKTQFPKSTISIRITHRNESFDRAESLMDYISTKLAHDSR